MLGYKTKFEEEEKEQIIKDFLPFIKYTAYRLSWRLPAHLTIDDLISVGFVGLVDAFNKFEHGRVKFSTYAEFRIKGAMLDELRAADWLSRSMKKKMSNINKAYTKLEKQLGRMPEANEVADALKLPLEEYYKIIQSAAYASPIRLDELNPDDNMNISDCIPDKITQSPLDILEDKDTKEKIAELLDKLPKKEKLVLSLYYWNELTLKEIGRVLNITESRACQIHSQAILRLKARLSELMPV